LEPGAAALPSLAEAQMRMRMILFVILSASIVAFVIYLVVLTGNRFDLVLGAILVAVCYAMLRFRPTRTRGPIA